MKKLKKHCENFARLNVVFFSEISQNVFQKGQEFSQKHICFLGQGLARITHISWPALASDTDARFGTQMFCRFVSHAWAVSDRHPNDFLHVTASSHQSSTESCFTSSSFSETSGASLAHTPPWPAEEAGRRSGAGAPLIHAAGLRTQMNNNE